MHINNITEISDTLFHFDFVNNLVPRVGSGSFTDEQPGATTAVGRGATSSPKAIDVSSGVLSRSTSFASNEFTILFEFSCIGVPSAATLLKYDNIFEIRINVNGELECKFDGTLGTLFTCANLDIWETGVWNQVVITSDGLNARFTVNGCEYEPVSLINTIIDVTTSSNLRVGNVANTGYGVNMRVSDIVAWNNYSTKTAEALIWELRSYKEIAQMQGFDYVFDVTRPPGDYYMDQIPNLGKKKDSFAFLEDGSVRPVNYTKPSTSSFWMKNNKSCEWVSSVAGTKFLRVSDDPQFNTAQNNMIFINSFYQGIRIRPGDESTLNFFGMSNTTGTLKVWNKNIILSSSLITSSHGIYPTVIKNTGSAGYGVSTTASHAFFDDSECYQTNIANRKKSGSATGVTSGSDGVRIEIGANGTFAFSTPVCFSLKMSWAAPDHYADSLSFLMTYLRGVSFWLWMKDFSKNMVLGGRLYLNPWSTTNSTQNTINNNRFDVESPFYFKTGLGTNTIDPTGNESHRHVDDRVTCFTRSNDLSFVGGMRGSFTQYGHAIGSGDDGQTTFLAYCHDVTSAGVSSPTFTYGSSNIQIRPQYTTNDIDLYLGGVLQLTVPYPTEYGTLTKGVQDLYVIKYTKNTGTIEIFIGTMPLHTFSGIGQATTVATNLISTLFYSGMVLMFNKAMTQSEIRAVVNGAPHRMSYPIENNGAVDGDAIIVDDLDGEVIDSIIPVGLSPNHVVTNLEPIAVYAKQTGKQTVVGNSFHLDVNRY